MIDWIDLRICICLIDDCLHKAHQRWERLDGLYSERIYLEGQLARLLHQQGKLDDAGLKRAWDDLDRRAAVYDDKCLDRWPLAEYLRDLSRRLRCATRKEEAQNAA